MVKIDFCVSIHKGYSPRESSFINIFFTLFSLHCSDYGIMYLISCCKVHILFFSTAYLNVIRIIYNLADIIKLFKDFQHFAPVVFSLADNLV